MAQSLLDTGEQRLFVTGLDIDDTAGQQAHLGKRRREQVRPRHAPEHLALGARRDPGGKQRCGRAVDCAIAATGDLMQGTQRQPASRQPAVDRRYAEWQDLPRATARTFETLDAVSKLGDDSADDRFGHFEKINSSGLCISAFCCYVLYLFPIAP